MAPIYAVRGLFSLDTAIHIIASSTTKARRKGNNDVMNFNADLEWLVKDKRSEKRKITQSINI